jgi:adenine deaminase
MMNFPGVIYGDKEVQAKLDLAKKLGKPIDGHAPGLTGEIAEKYVKAGITTDHECYTLEEAIEKIKLGMKILIREGSAAKNFDTLAPLIEEYPEMCMFCTDDAHPDSLSEGHIRDIVVRAFDLGYDVMDVLQIATLNPIRHYGLDIGLLQVGDPADFIVIDTFQNFGVEQTYVNGELIAEKGKTLIPHKEVKPINNFNCLNKNADEFKYFPKTKSVKVIKAIDGELITESIDYKPKFSKDDVEIDLNKDILKITVVNRYQEAKPAVALINNFGLKKGAIATSVSHDSHNLIAIGTDNESISKVINALIETKGGMVVYDGEKMFSQSLPIAGLMATDDGFEVAKKYKELSEKAKEIGCTLTSPFMTLAFMALLVIPKLKLSDKGLFDGEKFKYV